MSVDLSNWFHKIKNIWVENCFYREDFVKDAVFSHEWFKLGHTKFIDYDAFKNYYSRDKKRITFLKDEQKKTITFPFKEEVNFILYPNAKIEVRREILDYKMLPEIERLTDANFHKFMDEKPNTFDGENLRLASLQRTSVDTYLCCLERANYYSQIRTNLSPDFRMEDKEFPNLRVYDLGLDKTLCPLDKSVMVNTIGTSAVVYYRKDRNAYFLMMLRKQLGIFENMFGTTSGEVENPDRGMMLNNLTNFVRKEMEREFTVETGLNRSEIKFKMTPLALTRDLIRAGKPQYFFLIEINEITEKDFSRAFRKAIEGAKEFHSRRTYKSYSQNVLSPEFVLNLAYAFQAMLAEKCLDIDPLNLNHKLA